MAKEIISAEIIKDQTTFEVGKTYKPQNKPPYTPKDSDIKLRGPDFMITQTTSGLVLEALAPKIGTESIPITAQQLDDLKAEKITVEALIKSNS